MIPMREAQKYSSKNREKIKKKFIKRQEKDIDRKIQRAVRQGENFIHIIYDIPFGEEEDFFAEIIEKYCSEGYMVESGGFREYYISW